MPRYAPKPAVVAVAWVALLVAVTAGVLTADPVGRLLAIVAALLLAALALVGTVARPRLAADQDGVRVGRLRGGLGWSWPDVHRIEVMRTRRLGRESRVLELEVSDRDGTERLLVFTWLDLGVDPVDAAAGLRSLSPRSGS